MTDQSQLRKNDIAELDITGMGAGGEGIGRYNGFALFVKDALPGDRVRAVITKVNKGYGFAKTTEIIVPSPDRISPPCNEALRCGGCQMMQLKYEKQLELKTEKVRNDLERIGDFKDICMEPVMGMDEACPLHFRNKVQFPVGRSHDGRVITGFYAARTHYIIENEGCPAAPDETAGILSVLRGFAEKNGISVYDEKTGTGLLRHVLIRRGEQTGQIMVCIVINGNSLGKGLDDKLSAELLAAEPAVRSICLNVNKEKTNVILGRKTVSLYGNGYIEDRIGGLTFRISAQSFFQVNGKQTEKLYSKVLKYAELTGTETVWDLYCGTGTISLFLAQKARRVFGAEIVPEAVEDAKANAALNGISNTQFFCGRSEEIFPYMCKSHPADVVVLDPPRKGCDGALLDAILAAGPPRIVYVSCNSATLARDLKILSKKYELVKAAPCDMFPHTVHVETVVLMSIKDRKPDTHINVSLDMDDYHRIIGDEAEPEA